METEPTLRLSMFFLLFENIKIIVQGELFCPSEHLTWNKLSGKKLVYRYQDSYFFFPFCLSVY